MKLSPRAPLCRIPRCPNQKCREGALCCHHKWMNERYGDPLAKKPRGLTPEERFWLLVRRRKGRACWQWMGYRSKQGYGRFSTHEKTWVASRFAYTVVKGAIPPKKIVRHRCDNPKCVRPSHLLLGTHKDNRRDAIRRKRLPVGRRHWTRRRSMRHRLARGQRNARYTRPWTTPRGSRHGRAKLSYALADKIKRRYEAGKASQAQMARELGVDKNTVLDICKGRRWNRARDLALMRRPLAA